MTLTSYAHADTVSVHLRGLPVSLAAEVRERRADLLREFALITADVLDEGASPAGHEVPLRLLELMLVVTQDLHDLTEAAEARLQEAIGAGAQTIDDYVLELPREIASVTRMLGDLLEEADRYCWTEDRLVDLVTPPACAAYRRWVFAEVLDQLEGRRPVPWPDSAAARAL